MADATITGVAPVINKKRGGPKHFDFAVKGKNFGTDTAVTAKLVSGTDTYEWEVDGKDVHSDKLLYIRVKRKAGGPDSERKDLQLEQLEQVTVTMSNPGQTTPSSMSTDMGTYSQP